MVRPIWKELSRIGIISLKLNAVVVLIFTHFVEIGNTEGMSMLPTIMDKDFVVLDKTIVQPNGVVHLKLGDCVVASKPTNPHDAVCKRVTGLPGDYVLRDPRYPSEGYVKVPNGHCWLTGDNLPASKDSRHTGPVPLGLVRGRVARAFEWPFMKGSFLPRNWRPIENSAVLVSNLT